MLNGGRTGPFKVGGLPQAPPHLFRLSFPGGDVVRRARTARALPSLRYFNAPTFALTPAHR